MITLLAGPFVHLPPSLKAFMLPGDNRVYLIPPAFPASICGFAYSPGIPGSFQWGEFYRQNLGHRGAHQIVLGKS